MIRVPTSNRVCGEMTQWLVWVKEKQPEWDIDLEYTASYGLAAGRNWATRKLLQSDCTHLWQLDSDTVPPFSLHLLDHAEEYPVLCGPYVGCREGKMFWLVYENIEGDKFVPIRRKKWPPERIFKAAAGGGGCMLIQRQVFEKLGPDPWEYTVLANGQLGSEDINFCKKIGGCYVDSHYSCRHYRETDLLDVARVQGDAEIS